jgi:hypothetical protein
MSSEPAQDWQKLGPPPESAAAKAQLTYLQRMVEMFHRVEHPRLKALRRKLDATLVQLVQSAEQSTSATEVAQELAARLEALRRETFETLLVVVNQVRGTLKAKLAGGQSAAARMASERLHEGLTRFSKGLRELLSAADRNDPEAESAASKLMDEAAKSLDKEG